MAAANTPTFSYTCEICGLEGFSDEEMRAHTVMYHVEGQATCPFCDLTDLSSDEMLIHVNQAHLDFLTPEAELMVFIDDQSPAFDEDSDTISENHTNNSNTPGSIHNGWHTPTSNGFGSASSSHKTNHSQYGNGLRSTTSQSSIANGETSQGAKTKKLSGAQQMKEVLCATNKKSSREAFYQNGSFSSEAKSKKSDVSLSKTKSRSKSSSRQNSIENNYNGASKNEFKNNSGNNSSSDYELSPAGSKLSLSSAGQGSPLRSQLALKLKTNTPKKIKPATPSPPVIQCLMCDYTSDCAQRLEEHMNRAHFDLTSPSMNNANGGSNQNSSTAESNNPTLAYTRSLEQSQSSNLHCPLCEKTFAGGTDLELHVNIEHRDILSPQKEGATGIQEDNASYLQTAESMLVESSPSPGALVCPVCCQTLPNCTTQQDMTKHIEEHFERGMNDSSNHQHNAISDQQREVQRHREQREFEMLRAQYGMDEQGNYGQQAARGLRRAVYTGELSVRDYYERRIGLKRAESDGVDDSTSCTKGILPRIQALNAQNPSILRTHLCSAVDHYASTYGDRGWGCGFRNMQMLISSLVEHPAYGDVVYTGAWVTVGGGKSPAQQPRNAVPSISRLQLMVEHAWKSGFDTQGAEQLGSRLYNTRKWIGACEVVTVLSSLRIRCQLIDFHRPTGPDGGHPTLFAWVLNYFQENQGDFIPPLYLQHQGHSRTIIGCEVVRGSPSTGGGIRLLVLDPSHSAGQLKAGAGAAALRALRRAPPALRARQYQLVAIRGLMDSDEEYEASKVLKSVRIPQDR